MQSSLRDCGIVFQKLCLFFNILDIDLDIADDTVFPLELLDAKPKLK